MKTLLFSTLAAFLLYFAVTPSDGQEGKAGLGGFVVTNNHTAATNLVSTNTIFTKATLLGKRSATVNNTSTIRIGITNMQPFEIAPGGEAIISWGNRKMDFREIYMIVNTAGDGVVILYQ